MSTLFYRFLWLAAFLLSIYFFSESTPLSNFPERKVISANSGKKHLVLLGASVGKAWNLPFLPQRIKKCYYTFEYVGEYKFDKSAKLEEILSRQKGRPDGIVLKECATYFPGNLSHYQILMKQWVKECQEAKVVPILMTLAPVTRLHPYKIFLINLLKARKPLPQHDPFSRKRIKGILEYNGWIRNYCKENGLAIVDLEAALHYSDKNRYLREDFARRDGLHLNSKAYKALDQIIIPVLDKVNW
jgi:hypothetical protein